MKYRLEEIADVYDSLHQTPIYIKDGIPMVRVTDLGEGYLNLSKTLKVSEEVYNEFTKKYIPRKNDIIMSRVGTYGVCTLVNTEEKFCLGQNTVIISPKENKKFLYYYLMSGNVREQIESFVTGSTQKTISLKNIRNIIVDLPNEKQQEKISNILDNIDKKIELNNKIKDNLHEIILSIYNEKIRNNTNNIFEFKTLDEICNVFTGKKNANASDESGKYKFFTCAPEPLTINSYIYDGPAIIIAGNGAYTGRTTFYNGKFDLYQRTYAITEKELNNYIYVLYAMVESDLQENIMGGTHGSAIPYIVMNDIAKFKIKYNKEIFDELSNKFKSFLNKIKENEKENTTLIQLRDTLLPKLMNGQIDLDKIEI